MRLNLSAPILPGVGAAGVQLLDRFADVRMSVGPDASGHYPGLAVEWHQFGPVRLEVREGLVTAITVGLGYSGRIDDQIGIGSTLAEAAASLGPIVGHRRVLTCDGRPGVSFTDVLPPPGTKISPDWISDHPTAVIRGICVWPDTDPWVLM